MMTGDPKQCVFEVDEGVAAVFVDTLFGELKKNKNSNNGRQLEMGRGELPPPSCLVGLESSSASYTLSMN